MTENTEPNHWDALVSDLGVTPPPDVKRARKESPPEPDGAEVASEPSPTRGPAAASKPVPPPRRASTDWSELANRLGVVPQPETEVSRGAYLTEQPDEFADEPFAPTEALAEPEEVYREPAEAIAEPEGFSTQSDESIAERADEETEAKSGRPRRKRRRRGRKPGDADLDQDTEAPTVSDSDTESAEVVAEQPDGSDAAENDQPTSSGAESSPEKSKRRRRRRGSGRKKGTTEGDSELAPADQPPADPAATAVSSSGPAAETPDRAKPTDRQQTEQSAQDSTGAKAAHRAIPCWEEAIGVIVAANMEARAKKKTDAGSSSRSRGGRGRGPRDRSSEKST